MKNRTTTDLIILIIFTLACLLPFINKPFNIDDPFYISMAKQILNDPLRPYSFSINWSGELRDVWTHMEATFPPLIPYFIAAMIKLFGIQETILHLCFLVFPLISAASMYFLLKKYVGEPLVYAMIFVAAPAFLVSATSIMLDVPLMAFILLSAALFIYGVDGDDKRLILSGSVVAGLAVLVKYSAVIAVIVLGMYVAFSGKRKYILYLLVPAGIFGLWCLHNQLVYGKMHFFEASSHVGKGISLHKLIAAPAFFAGSLIFPVFLFFKQDLREKLIFIITPMVFYVLVDKFIKGPNAAVILTLMIAASALYFYTVIKYRKQTNQFVFTWFAVAVFLVLTVEPWVSGRYILFILPPALILFAAMIEGIAGTIKKYIPVAALLTTLFFGLSLSISDYLWAKTYVRIPEYFNSRGVNNGFFLGHFGFQYYMERSGFLPLEVNGAVKGPVFILAAKMPDPQKPAKKIFSRMKLKEHHMVPSTFPFRIMAPVDHAGFYSSFWGILPFTISREPLEEFAVFTLDR